MEEVRTPPFGYCIYCGAAGRRVKLTNEHAIPYALDGNVVLTKASCLACARVTGQIEQNILRGMIYEARTYLKMRTRRPKERPKAFPAKDQATGEVVNLPVSQAPFLLRLPLLMPAPILEGVTRCDWVGLQVNEEQEAFWTVWGTTPETQLDEARKFSKDWEFSASEFVMFLAKIAYCSALYMNGPWSFEPVLGPLIAARKDDEIIPYVGGYESVGDPRKKDAPFLVNVRTTTEWIWVELSPFANLGAPSYQVFVGRPAAASISRSWPKAALWTSN